MVDGPGRASLDYFIARAFGAFSSDRRAGPAALA